MDVVPNIWMTYDHVLPDLSYDLTRLELWVIGYVDDNLGPYYTIRVCFFWEVSSLAIVAPPGPVPTTI